MDARVKPAHDKSQIQAHWHETSAAARKAAVALESDKTAAYDRQFIPCDTVIPLAGDAPSSFLIE